jgi:hypothetical protein
MLAFVCFLLAVSSAASAASSYRSENGLLAITLELKEFIYTDPVSHLSFVTRAFNDQIPGTTLLDT